MAVDTGATGTRQTMGGADACQGGRDRGEERAKAAIDRSRSGSTGSAIMALFLAAADRCPGAQDQRPGQRGVRPDPGGGPSDVGDRPAADADREAISGPK